MKWILAAFITFHLINSYLVITELKKGQEYFKEQHELKEKDKEQVFILEELNSNNVYFKTDPLKPLDEKNDNNL